MAYNITLTSPSYNASGKFGQSLNGGTGTAPIAALPTNGTFTIELWLKQSSNPGATKVALGSNAFFIGCDSAGNVLAHYGSGGSGSGEVTLSTTGKTIVDGAWHHVELDLSSAGGKLFLDGVLVASNASTMAQANAGYTGNITFRTYTVAGYDWPGEIDEVAIWSTANHSTAFSAPTTAIADGTSGLTALWHLNGNGSDTASQTPTAPATPSAPVATVASSTSATVVLTAPSDGGSAITGYTVTSSPAGGVDSNAGSTSLTHTITGLTTGTAYTFTFTATNAVGTSSPSPASNSVTPTSTTLASGSASFVSATNTTINMTCGAATGGTTPYTYQWYRSTTSGFTPASGNLLAGATNLTLADSTGLSADTPYFYVCRATDSTSAVADSVQVAGVLKAAQLNIGFIGDSNTFGYGLPGGTPTMPDNVAVILGKTYKSRTVTCTNRGVSGTKSPDWISGSTNLTNAKAAFAAAGVTHVHYAIGTNDAIVPTSAATYKSNVQSTVNDLVAAGYKVILSYLVYSQVGGGSTSGASIAYAQQYMQQIDSLINGTTILRGDTLAYNYFIDNLGEFQSDKLHLTATGAVSWATMIARAIDRAVLDTSASTGAPLTPRTVTLTLTDSTGSPRANLSGLKWAFFDQVRPDIFAAPTSQGAVATTDGSGQLVISVNTSLSSGSTGWLDITDSDGTTTQSPAAKAFSGPVVLS
jgi:lysophospholipase L1-like esterase